jgi:hypothetical protein
LMLTAGASTAVGPSKASKPRPRPFGFLVAIVLIL